MRQRKSYKSGKKSFTPSSGQKSKVDLNKKDSNVNSQKTTPDSKTKATNTAPKSNKGSFMKGLLLGGLGGLLMGSFICKYGSSWFCISVYGKYVSNGWYRNVSSSCI